MDTVDTLFINMLKQHAEDLRSGTLPKGKFVGKYMRRLKEIAGNDAFRYKRPQVIGDGNEPNNNWLDYMLSLTDEEMSFFMEAISYPSP